MVSILCQAPNSLFAVFRWSGEADSTVDQVHDWQQRLFALLHLDDLREGGDGDLWRRRRDPGSTATYMVTPILLKEEWPHNQWCSNVDELLRSITEVH